MSTSIRSFSMLMYYVIATSIFSCGQDQKDNLDLQLAGIYNENVLPGFAAAIVNMDGILYQSALGYANIESREPYTTKTMQCIASTTKTTIAYATMKLIEQEKLSLDSPINDFLPFEIVNPHFKDSIIRIRHLVTHTSGIVDTENNYDLRTYYYTEKTSLVNSKLDPENLQWLSLLKPNSPLPLSTYYKEIFSTSGKWYDESSFHNKPIGKHYTYSNVGAGLMAYIIECIVGESFDTYIQENVFDILEMTDTKFHEINVPEDRLATNYISENLIETPSLGFSNYPDGGIYTHIEDLSIYLMEMIKGYNGNSNLLTDESFRTMMSPQLLDSVAATNPQKRFDNIGVFWQLDNDGSIKHYGGNPYGSSIYFSFNPETNIGKILMTNCDIRASRETVKTFLGIWGMLEKYESIL